MEILVHGVELFDAHRKLLMLTRDNSTFLEIPVQGGTGVGNHIEADDEESQYHPSSKILCLSKKNKKNKSFNLKAS